MPARSDPTLSRRIPPVEPEVDLSPAETGRRSFLLRGSAGIAVAIAAGSTGGAWAAAPSGADSNQISR